MEILTFTILLGSFAIATFEATRRAVERDASRTTPQAPTIARAPAIDMAKEVEHQRWMAASRAIRRELEAQLRAQYAYIPREKR